MLRNKFHGRFHETFSKFVPRQEPLSTSATVAVVIVLCCVVLRCAELCCTVFYYIFLPCLVLWYAVLGNECLYLSTELIRQFGCRKEN